MLPIENCVLLTSNKCLLFNPGVLEIYKLKKKI